MSIFILLNPSMQSMFTCRFEFLPVPIRVTAQAAQRVLLQFCFLVEPCAVLPAVLFDPLEQLIMIILTIGLVVIHVIDLQNKK